MKVPTRFLAQALAVGLLLAAPAAALAVGLTLALPAAAPAAPPAVPAAVDPPLARLEAEAAQARAFYERSPAAPETQVYYVRALTNLGVGLFKTGQTAAAQQVVERALGMAPRYVPAIYAIALIDAESGRPAAAVHDLRALLRLQPRHAAALVMLAELAVELQLYDEAVEHYKTALQILPGHPKITTDLGLTYAHLGRHLEALDCLEAVTRLSPDDPSAWTNVAQAHIDMEQYGKAIEAYRRAQRLAPLAGDAATNLAMALGKLGRFAEGLEAVELALAREPDHVGARFERCRLLASLGRLDGAIDCFRDLETRAPQEHKARAEEGALEERRKRLDKAEDAYRHAIIAGERGPAIYEALARVLDAQGRAGEATAYRSVARALAGSPPTTAAIEAGPPPSSPAAPRTGSPGPLPGTGSITAPPIPPPASGASGAAPSSAPGLTKDRLPRFQDIAARVGLDFRHSAGLPALWIPQVMGSGCAMVDVDGDGFDDVYLVNGFPAPRPDARGTIDWRSFYETSPRAAPGNRLYRNVDGHLVDITDLAGVRGGTYGMGVCELDANQDGYPDLLVTGLWHNLLFINNGDGTFKECAAAAGLAGGDFATGASAGDLDGDGWPDLYVASYVHFGLDDLARVPQIGHTPATMYDLDTTSPSSYDPQPSHLYRNRRDGTFEDVAGQAGATNDEVSQGKGLGCLVFDHDGDGLLDIYVANDTRPNSLYANRGGRRFANVAAREWVDDSRGSMGIAAGDASGSGLLDLFVTNWTGDACGFYSRTKGRYVDATVPAGLGDPPLDICAWGTAFVDLANAGRPDLVQVDGATAPPLYQPVRLLTDPTPLSPQRWRIAMNRGDGTFEDVSRQALAFVPPSCARGLALSDLFHDGQVELLIQAHEGRALLLRDLVVHPGTWVELELVGTHSARDATGATVEVVTRNARGQPLRRQAQVLASGGSYLSQSSLHLHFGLGTATRVDEVRVHWPGLPTAEIFGPLAPQSIHRLVQGRGRPAAH